MPDIAILGGCGHVGLPLGLAFARAGKTVAAIDSDPQRVAQTAAGRMPFADRGADDLLKRTLAAGTFRPTPDPAAARDADALITVVGTPIDEHLNPSFDSMRDLVLAHRPHFRPGQLLVVRSTVLPGTTARLAALVPDLDVAFCPERVAQGFALEEIASLPQIVGGVTPRAQARAEALFRLIAPDVVPMQPLAAELTKLFTNSWRYVQFAVANQFWTMANEYGIDFYEIFDAMTRNYPRAKDLPRAGFTAGPCLFKDTMMLSAFHNNAFFLGHAAMLVNEGLPNYLVQRAARRFKLGEMTAAILGMTFKADSDDPRDSLAIKLRRILEGACRRVVCTDPFLREPWVSPLEEALRADILFIGAPHSAYRGLDFGGKPVVDVWAMTPQRLKTL